MTTPDVDIMVPLMLPAPHLPPYFIASIYDLACYIPEVCGTVGDYFPSGNCLSSTWSPL